MQKKKARKRKKRKKSRIDTKRGDCKMTSAVWNRKVVREGNTIHHQKKWTKQSKKGRNNISIKKRKDPRT